MPGQKQLLRIEGTNGDGNHAVADSDMLEIVSGGCSLWSDSFCKLVKRRMKGRDDVEDVRMTAAAEVRGGRAMKRMVDTNVSIVTTLIMTYRILVVVTVGFHVRTICAAY